ncbi:CDP-alcohol phosphatidyltransferase family protein [Psychroserpens ponticola]|uniref:CDP-alcohol phosphatidyltransferase family protein n=1 Tax=Psychroserpens ponticola TaxID=2932268 RepID=A0ABY7RZU2_9FLAO|nr:CDP-alcohol phosphatidyltransferase family protein [Psychroserpens ponticola]WCO02553.1 CDP-alcohol phosphatidyltransferase family protein [Psychroserpens ponticola]
MSINKYIPNFVTLLNLLSGSIAVVFAVHNNFVAAALFVFLGIFFDFFDGLLARKLNVQSELGIQLDSLADMVTSGLVPGIVMFKLMSMSVEAPEMMPIQSWNSNFNVSNMHIEPIALVGLFITLASAYRLAKFNIDEDQQAYFKGLPTPANTLLIMSLPLIIEFQNSDIFMSLISNLWFLIVLTIVSCYLLNSDIKLFALKFKNFDFSDNKFRYILIVLSILLMVLFHFIAIPLIIILYIVLSILKNATTK